MSFVRVVALMVREMGQATVEDLSNRLGGKYNDRQVRKAVANARAFGWIKSSQRLRGSHQKRGMTVYVPAGEKPQEVGPLQTQIVEIVRKSGKATVSEIAEHFPSKERYQINRALDNLKNSGRLEQARRLFSGETERDNCWYVMPGCTVRVTSVFDLGSERLEEFWPKGEGRVYNLLGSWGDESASNDSRQAA